MKKQMLLLLVMMLGLSGRTYASAGRAYDTLAFILVLIGFLLVVAGLLEATDYLRRNGRKMINRSITVLKKKREILLEFLRKVKADYLDFSY